MCIPCQNESDGENTTTRITDIDDFIAGTSFLFTSILGLFGYALVFPAIRRSKKLRHPCYAIIFSLGISDAIGLFAWIIIGLHTVTHARIFPQGIIKHSLCVLVIGWGSLTVHIGVLSVNRFLAICYSEKHDIIFSKRYMIIFLIGCWIYAIFIHAFPTFLPPNMDYTLDGYIAFWYNPIVSDYYYIEDISWCTTVFALNLACYAAIIMKYRNTRNQFVALPAKTAAARMTQFRLAIQCVVRCFSFYTYDVLYYVIGYMTENIWLTFLCSTYLWAFNNALSPWVYLIFDRQLRKVVKTQLFGRIHKEEVAPVSIAIRPISVLIHWQNQVHPAPIARTPSVPDSMYPNGRSQN